MRSPQNPVQDVVLAATETPDAESSSKTLNLVITVICGGSYDNFINPVRPFETFNQEFEQGLAKYRPHDLSRQSAGTHARLYDSNSFHSTLASPSVLLIRLQS